MLCSTQCHPWNVPRGVKQQGDQGEQQQQEEEGLVVAVPDSFEQVSWVATSFSTNAPLT
jgi:hypothetical protein